MVVYKVDGCHESWFCEFEILFLGLWGQIDYG